MMLLLTANTVVMMAIAIGLWCFAVLPIVFVAHLVLALGIMPLILATMAYFVPILTRSDNASRSIDGMDSPRLFAPKYALRSSWGWRSRTDERSPK